jgi:hypothetical protein
MFKGSKLQNIYCPKVYKISGDTNKGAFQDCTYLEEINLPIVKTLGCYSFYGCL